MARPRKKEVDSQTENKVSESESSKLTEKAVDAAHKGMASVNQSLIALQGILDEACKRTFAHALQFGDVRLADKFIKGIPEGPMAKQWQLEMVAWFRKNSPIRWDANKVCKLLKEGEADFKPFNAAQAEAEPFFEMPEVKKARAIANNARKQALQPVTFENFKGRVAGLRRWFKSAQEPNAEGETRGVVEKDKAKIENGLTVIEAVFDTYEAGKISAEQAKLLKEVPAAVQPRRGRPPVASRTDDLKSETRKSAAA